MSLKLVEPNTAADEDPRIESLGIVLIASSNKLFADALGYLVLEAGFTPAFPSGMEAPWISVTRTQPRVVICDYDAPVKRLRRMIADVAARRVPLLMIHTGETHGNPPALARVERVTWQRIPISAEELRRVLTDLMPPEPDRGGPHEIDPAEAEREHRLDGARSA